MKRRLNVAWIAPNLNHYRSRLLSRLNESPELNLHVLAGQQQQSLGHSYDTCQESFTVVELCAAKSELAWSPRALRRIVRYLREFRPDIVLMPLELKHTSVIVMLAFMKRMLGFKLVSYNHSFAPRHSNPGGPRVRTFLLRRLILLYDHIVFYSSDCQSRSISSGFVRPGHCSWATNTLDIESIRQRYHPTYELGSPPSILYLGRLLPQKGVRELLEYFAALRRQIPDLRLEIIGDGPLRDAVSKAADVDASITWHGAVADENRIRSIMQRIDVVLIPGETGLGIVHAFAYGKPYLTVDAEHIDHGPELDSLIDEENGLRLSGDRSEDISRMARLLTRPSRYTCMCKGAFDTGTQLSPSRWVDGIIDGFRISLGSASRLERGKPAMQQQSSR